MSNMKVNWLAVLSLIIVASAGAQSGATGGAYRIVGGRYTECCGIAGPFFYNLPDTDQAFVELTLDAQQGRARMRILGDAGQAVFHTIHNAPGLGFEFDFNNGMVFPDYIVFGPFLPAPGPTLRDMLYVVSNTVDGLRLNGVVNTPCPGCADIPTQFKHTNVLAMLVPSRPAMDRVARDGNSLTFHFTGEPPNDYTVEYTESLVAPKWETLSVHRAKLTTIDVEVKDWFTNGPARFYRLRKEPCLCD
jgi:hypothetical protein